jgi:GMP synthase (glutamine-hydrolysing)
MKPDMPDPTVKKRIVLVTHSAQAEPGHVRDAVQARGCETDVCCTFLGDELPRFAGGRVVGFDAAIVFGGPMGAGDLDEHPFLRAETAWIAGQVEADAPILGICLGAQIMARGMGGAVYRHPQGKCEIGYQPIVPANQHCPIFPAPFHAYQWHREGFDPPEGAKLLATGAMFENQAFSCGQRAFGIQFHPEMTPATMERWLAHENAQADLARPEAPSADTQRAGAPAHDPAVHAWFDSFIDLWLARF